MVSPVSVVVVGRFSVGTVEGVVAGETCGAEVTGGHTSGKWFVVTEPGFAVESGCVDARTTGGSFVTAAVFGLVGPTALGEVAGSGPAAGLASVVPVVVGVVEGRGAGVMVSAVVGEVSLVAEVRSGAVVERVVGVVVAVVVGDVALPVLSPRWGGVESVVPSAVDPPIVAS